MTIVWEWGSDFDLLVNNCQKYVSLEWQDDVGECAILLHGIEQQEGVVYSIVGYTRNRAKVIEIASKSLMAALGTKIWYCSVDFSKGEFSKGADIQYGEEELPGRVKLLVERVKQKLLKEHEILRNEVKETGKELVVGWNLYLRCRVRSPGITYIIDCHNARLDIVLSVMKKLASSLGEVAGFAVDERVEDPVLIDREEIGNRLYVTAIEKSQLKV